MLDADGNFVKYVGKTGLATEILNLQSVSVAVEDYSSLANVYIYPTPAVDKFTVRTGIPGAIHIEVMDLLGQRLIAGEFAGEPAKNVAGLPPGFYLVRVRGEQGSGTHQLRILR